eukprot:5046053-Pleurochrysis_carterae.AAC.2
MRRQKYGGHSRERSSVPEGSQELVEVDLAVLVGVDVGEALHHLGVGHGARARGDEQLGRVGERDLAVIVGVERRENVKQLLGARLVDARVGGGEALGLGQRAVGAVRAELGQAHRGSVGGEVVTQKALEAQNLRLRKRVGLARFSEPALHAVAVERGAAASGEVGSYALDLCHSVGVGVERRVELREARRRAL